MSELKDQILQLMMLGLTKHDIVKSMNKLNDKFGLTANKLESLYQQCVHEYCKEFKYNVRSMSVKRESVI